MIYAISKLAKNDLIVYIKYSNSYNEYLAFSQHIYHCAIMLVDGFKSHAIIAIDGILPSNRCQDIS